MKNKNIFKISYIIICIMQVLILSSGFILEYLTTKKAGVMHHVYYRKYQFENGLFSNNNMQFINIVTISLGILLLLVFIFSIKHIRANFCKAQILITAMISFFIYLAVNMNYFINKIAYHYFIMFFMLVLIIQIIILIITSVIYKRNSSKI